MPRKLSEKEYLDKLHYTVYSQSPEEVKNALSGLSGGGKKDIRDILNGVRKGTRLLDWPSEQMGAKSGKIATLLMNHGTDPGLPDSNCMTPIKRAISNENYEVVSAIPEHHNCSHKIRGEHWKVRMKVKKLMRPKPKTLSKRK